MSETVFSTGDRVRHAGKPEWGIGTIQKVEAAPDLPVNGHARQRLSIRFPNAGLKTLVTGFAELMIVPKNGPDAPLNPYNAAGADSPLVEYWNKMSDEDSDWLAPAARRKMEEQMLTLPMEARDQFNSVAKRLAVTLALYRFDRSGRGLIDWAVAQTELDDPLSRFTRHELEQRFDRWALERDNHLARLLHEARSPGSGGMGGMDAKSLHAAIAAAPPSAQRAVRRIQNNGDHDPGRPPRR